MPVQKHGDFLIAFAVQVFIQDLLLQAAQHLVHPFVDASQFLLIDQQLLRIGDPRFRNDIQQRPVAFLVIKRLVQGNIAVQRNMLLTRGRFDRGNDLPGNA